MKKPATTKNKNYHKGEPLFVYLPTEAAKALALLTKDGTTKTEVITTLLTGAVKVQA